VPNYDNNLRGVLWQNDKGDNAGRPDYKGHCEIGGVKYWVSLWKKAKDGKPYCTLQFEAAGGSTPQRSSAPVVEDDVPF
jgi:hypothetical protein